MSILITQILMLMRNISNKKPKRSCSQKSKKDKKRKAGTRVYPGMRINTQGGVFFLAGIAGTVDGISY